jgi:predicted O-methyltransferase YrrM
MTSRHIPVTPALASYLHEVAFREHPVLARLRQEAATLPEGGMQIGPEQGALMALLVRLIAARRILEVGTFTGYSSTAMALALPPDGRMTCLDRSPEWTDVARRAWEEAGLADRIELRLGPAAETLATLGDDDYDLAFIDADKGGYDTYYEECLRVVRGGGLVLLDNTLQHGRVADPDASDANVTTIRALNAKIVADERVEMVLLPIGDGLTIVRVR